MESVIGLIIFVAILSLISRLTQQKANDEANRRRRVVRPEDLPEKTRRMIYGDSSPTARPKQRGLPAEDEGVRVAKPAEPKEGRPIQVRDIMEALLGEFSDSGESRRDLPENAGMRPVEVRKVPEDVRRLEAGPSPSKPSVPRPSVQRPIQPQKRVQRTVMKTAVRAERHAPPREGPKPVAQPVGKRPEHPVRQPKTSDHLTRKLIRSPRDLRYGIILSEILGPPKAFRI